MKNINLIFDCDGTIINSYTAIVEQLYQLFLQNGADCSKDYIRKMCLYYDSRYCIREISNRYGIDYDSLMNQRKTINEDISLITLYEGAYELVRNEKFNCFVYTHRGSNCRDIFNSFAIDNCFIEIVDASYGFRRKPDSQAIDYLVEKYHLDKRKTYYIGDRSIDIECGINAGIGTIFLNSNNLDIDSSKADFTVNNLKEITVLPFEERN